MAMNYGYGPGFGGGFGAFGVFFAIAFILILGMIVVSFAKGIGQWNKNNHSPRLTVAATVVSKRTDVTHHHHHTGNDHIHHHHHSTTDYYVTFQVESGDRMELHVPDTKYGYMVEGDHGNLSFQGTRFLGFERL